MSKTNKILKALLLIGISLIAIGDIIDIAMIDTEEDLAEKSQKAAITNAAKTCIDLILG